MEHRKKKEDNELILIHNPRYNYEDTIKYFKLMIINKFRFTNEYIISCTSQTLPLINMAFDEISHMGYLRDRIRSEIVKDENDNKIEYIKIPVELITACVQLKKDRKPYD